MSETLLQEKTSNDGTNLFSDGSSRFRNRNRFDNLGRPPRSFSSSGSQMLPVRGTRGRYNPAETSTQTDTNCIVLTRNEYYEILPGVSPADQLRRLQADVLRSHAESTTMLQTVGELRADHKKTIQSLLQENVPQGDGADRMGSMRSRSRSRSRSQSRSLDPRGAILDHHNDSLHQIKYLHQALQKAHQKIAKLESQLVLTEEELNGGSPLRHQRDRQSLPRASPQLTLTRMLQQMPQYQQIPQQSLQQMPQRSFSGGPAPGRRRSSSTNSFSMLSSKNLRRGQTSNANSSAPTSRPTSARVSPSHRPPI